MRDFGSILTMLPTVGVPSVGVVLSTGLSSVGVPSGGVIGVTGVIGESDVVEGGGVMDGMVGSGGKVVWSFWSFVVVVVGVTGGVRIVSVVNVGVGVVAGAVAGMMVGVVAGAIVGFVGAVLVRMVGAALVRIVVGRVVVDFGLDGVVLIAAVDVVLITSFSPEARCVDLDFLR